MHSLSGVLLFFASFFGGVSIFFIPSVQCVEDGGGDWFPESQRYQAVVYSLAKVVVQDCDLGCKVNPVSATELVFRNLSSHFRMEAFVGAAAWTGDGWLSSSSSSLSFLLRSPFSLVNFFFCHCKVFLEALGIAQMVNTVQGMKKAYGTKSFSVITKWRTQSFAITLKRNLSLPNFV